MSKSLSTANVHFAPTVNEVPVEVNFDDDLVHSGRRLKHADHVEAKLLDEWFEQEETQPSVSRRFRRVGQRIQRVLGFLFLLVAAVAALIVVRNRQSAIETPHSGQQKANVTALASPKNTMRRAFAKASPTAKKAPKSSLASKNKTVTPTASPKVKPVVVETTKPLMGSATISKITAPKKHNPNELLFEQK